MVYAVISYVVAYLAIAVANRERAAYEDWVNVIVFAPLTCPMCVILLALTLYHDLRTGRRLRCFFTGGSSSGL